jgi:hypothetical protein
MDNANHGCGTSMLPQPSQRHNWFAIEKMEINDAAFGAPERQVLVVPLTRWVIPYVFRANICL